jgi:hypothetical protein
VTSDEEMTGFREEVSGELHAAREEATRVRHLGSYFWLIMVLTAVIGPAVSVLISVHNTHRSEMKLCTVVVTTDDAWLANPPTSPAGIKQAENFHQLRRALGCPPYKGE